MTFPEAKNLYLTAGGFDGHSAFDWNNIHKEIQAIVDAKSDRAAGKIIHWWGCWDRRYTATAFARRVRVAYINQAQAQTPTEMPERNKTKQ